MLGLVRIGLKFIRSKAVPFATSISKSSWIVFFQFESKPSLLSPPTFLRLCPVQMLKTISKWLLIAKKEKAPKRMIQFKLD